MTGTRSERIAAFLKLIAGEAGLESLKPTGEHMLGGLATNGGLEGMGDDGGLEVIQSGFDSLLNDQPLSDQESFGLEAIIDARLRPSIPLAEHDFVSNHDLWTELSDQDVKRRFLAIARSVGRIEAPGSGLRYGGTGFVVGDGLVMTNRHVAAIFQRGSGAGPFASFISGVTPGFNRSPAPESRPADTIKVERVVMIHPYWDMALLSVAGLPREAAPLPLSSMSIDAYARKRVAVVGYPAEDRRADAADQAAVFKAFGVKQLQPGVLHGRTPRESFRRIVIAVGHDCSTLGGNSGSAVVDIETGHVVALHFAGVAKTLNYAVPMSELALDGRVVDAGVLFDPSVRPERAPSWSGAWNETPLRLAPEPASPPAKTVPEEPDGSRSAPGAVNLVIPLHISVRLGDGPAVVAAVSGAQQDGSEEKLVEPWRNTDYATRRGYRSDFLGIDAPMPEPADPGVVAPPRAGAARLDYQNFSLFMHAKRRIALITAANVTAEKALKRPEEGRVYTRGALSGIGENDQERWFLDPRLDESFQLPDVFYTRDDKAFDKGHIVRRDDVAWGETFDLLRVANGDTYHVTNCSPQVKPFNQSAHGRENWGDLENVVLDQAASERLCVFAGPVLADDDPRFLGRLGGRQRAIVQIPVRFWKVVVARSADGLAAFGFVLKQDLSDVRTEEFAVPEEFEIFMHPLSEIARVAGVVFDPGVLTADAFEERGEEVALRVRAARMSRSV
jgi:endonuclease G